MQKYSKILSELDIAAHLVYNTHAKKVLDEFYSEEEEEQPTRKQKKQQQKQPRGRSETKEKSAKPKVDESKKRQTKTRVEKIGLSTNDKKKLDNLYLKGPASFGNAKRLQNLSKLSMKKVNMYLETKPFFTKYRSRRLRFPRLKVIVNDLNEIWSVDLAFVDKLAKYNSGVKYLLVAVDCLSRYLRFEPLKTKYATETAEVFKKMIKHKQLKKFGSMMVQSSSVLSKPSAINAEFIYTVRSARKSLLLLREIYVPSKI